MYTVIAKRLLSHISSFTLGILFIGFYLVGDNAWLDAWLPINGKPLAIFSLLAIVIVYELAIRGNKQVAKCIKGISEQQHIILHRMDVNRLIQAVNGMYGRFENSEDEYIDNEYSIKELNELKDMRERLKVNSYTQGRLEFLCSKIRRD